ncbi:MAG: hypothetical protein Q4C25_00705 [Bacillota bacterium]|nr:hypothetical protein [Bacillota bacterium]
METGRFKNDNRAASSIVIDHMVREAEKQIKKMTGKDVKLRVETEE